MKSLNFAVRFAGLCLLVVLHSVPCSAAVSANIPLDSWVYPVLDKLAGLDLVDSSLAGSRPYTRLEACRQTLEARNRLESASYPPVAGELLRRLETEFRTELTELAMQAPPPPPRFTLERRGAPIRDDGVVFLPYALINKGTEPATFELGASPRGVLFYADADRNGRPDDPSPLSAGITLAAGEPFTFVVAVPASVSGVAADSANITVTAASPLAPRQPLLWFVPVRELRLDYVFQEGEDSLFPTNDAHQFAPNYNNFGIAYREHHNAQAVFESEARLGRYLLVNLRPLVALQEGGGASMRLLQGEVALGLGPVELSAGRQSLWWGPGRHGALVLTNNAKPLDMVRLTNPVPATLPWILEYLGPFRFDFFLSRLEDDRVVPEPYFGGLRFNIRPASWLELGASRTVQFGGEGRPDVKFDDFLTILGGENVGGSSESNQLAAIDARLIFPFLAGAEIYAEMGGEDEGDLLGFIPFPSKKALLAGLYLPRVEPTGRLGLRLEYANLNYEGNGDVWYRHGLYPYTYDGKILGHHAGGDARDFYAELQCFLPRDITVTAAYDREVRGISTSVEEEEHDQPSLELRWAATSQLELHARYAYDRVHNFGFVDGEDREFHFLTTGVTARW